MNMAHPHTDPHGHDTPHVMPTWLLLAVFAGLIALTVITVLATRVQLGALNIWVALAIAVIKAGLVAMYFMHLRYDAPFHGIVMIIAFVFVAVFIGITLLDVTEYKVNYEPPASMAPQR